MNEDVPNRPLILDSGPFGVAESDCACADTSVEGRVATWAHDGWITSHHVRVSVPESDCRDTDFVDAVATPLPRTGDLLLQRTAGLYSVHLDEEHTVVFNVRGVSQLAVLNLAAHRVLNCFGQPTLVERVASMVSDCGAEETLQAAVRLAEIGILEPVGVFLPPLRSAPQTLTGWLHVTNACNLRCTYCYVDKTDEAMDETTGRAAVDAVLRSATRNGFRSVKLKYAGGESTLNFALVRVLHQYAVQRASADGLALHEVVLSNGVGLTGAMLDFIRDADMRLMISIDGLGADHDTQRIFFNGRGSSRHVARSIDRAIAQGVKPHLSITVTRHNAASIAAAVAFALDRDLLFNLNFYREHDTGNTHQELAAEDADLITGVRAAFQVIEERLPRHSLMAALVDRSNFTTPHDRPCGAGHSYLVIDHGGRVARCQMELERTVTDIMAQDPLEIIRLQPTGFDNVSVEDKEGCRDCQWRYWCAGGCPLLTYRVTGRSDVKSPYCHVYKALFPDLLRLEGLRLMKWAVAEAQ